MIEVIPAIDIIGGKCVRLTKGRYDQSTVYADDPLEMALRFEDAGCKRLHLVDLDGAKASHIVNHRTLCRIATRTSLVIDFGGGLKSGQDLDIAFDNGAAMITGGSIAVKRPDIFGQWIERYGGDKIILGADARDGKISTSGWMDDSDLELIPFVRDYVAKGVTKIISTDISVDGTLSGPSIEMYNNIGKEIPEVYIIASGGVGSMRDIEELERNEVPAVIVGKALYEGRVSLKELETINLRNQ